MKKLLALLALSLFFCSKGFAVDSLSDGKKGTIKFESIPVVTLNQFLKGETKGDSVKISGKLKFPKKKWTGRRPAVVILHGGGGGGTNEEDWAKGLRKIGIATFVLDSNSARGCRKQEKKVIICKNGYLHQGLGHIPDAYRALDLLSTHPLIDPNRIALMGFSIGGKAALYASVKRFQKMWGTPGLEFAAYVPFYPGCKTVFENDEIISDRPIRIFFGDTDDFVSHVLCEEYVNRLRKTGADVTITVYPNATHAFDFKPDSRGTAVKVKSGSGVNYRNCRFVEDLSSDRMALGVNDKNNKELKTLQTQCLSLFPNRKKVCLIGAYTLLETSNAYYGPEVAKWFADTVTMKEKMCKMEGQDTTSHETVEETKEEIKEEINTTVSELDSKFAEAVETYILKKWGDSDWEKGFIKCMIGHSAILSTEVKETIIEHGPEKAFKKISNENDGEAYNKVFQACEKNSEKALEAASAASESQSQSSTTSSEHSSEAEIESSIAKLEEYIVETAEKFEKEMMHFMADSSCAAKTNNTTKYQKEAAKKVRKAVADFFINTFEITPL